METAAQEIARLGARLSELRAELRSPLEQEALRADPVEVLTGRIGGERIALLVRSISEVVPMPKVAVLPEAPSWVTGLLDLRGQLIPVIDVEARIARARRTARATDFVVVCAEREAPVGLAVRGIERVQALHSDRLVEPSPDVPMAPYVLRVVHDEKGMVLLLSVERLVCMSDLPSIRA
jgi:purine-binding chemotaxis protein CheW